MRLVIGGSLGGMQTLEWALMYPELVEAIVPVANPARHSPWAIGLSEAQRQAIFADPLWQGRRYRPDRPPAAGLAAARMMAMCTYRSRDSFEERFGRRAQTADLFAVESYLRYQGQQLVDRFGAEHFPYLPRLQQAVDNFEFRISPPMADLIKEPSDPIWRQYRAGNACLHASVPPARDRSGPIRPSCAAAR